MQIINKHDFVTFSKNYVCNIFIDKYEVKMKKIFLLVLVVFSVSIFSQEEPKEMQRIKIAVIPSSEGDQYTNMVEAALGTDQRFDFIDRSKIPQILEEWERRQAGITEEDNTESLALKNVDFLVQLDNIVITPVKKYEEIPEEEKQDNQNSGVINIIINPQDEKEKYAYWEVTISAVLKVTNVNEGGSTRTRQFRASAEAKEKGSATQMAVRQLENQIKIAVKKLFPIQARLTDVQYATIKILRGSNSGVQKGQRYIIKNKKQVTVNGKTYTSYTNSGIVQVYQVGEEFSEAYIIMSDDDYNPQDAKVVEKYYSGGSFELNFGIIAPETASSVNQNWKDINFTGGFDVLFGIDYQAGFGMQFAYNDGFYRMSVPDLQIRYNMHIIRRLYWFAGAIGNVELALKETDLRLDDGNDTLVSNKSVWPVGYAFSGFFYTGFKFHVDYSGYLFIQGGYTIANKYKWVFSPDEETDEQKKESIENYTDYIESYKPNGFTLRLGLGVNF